MKKISLPLLIVIATASLLWLPNLLAKGMFMDGVYDALFAHNLAKGVSTFWAPQTIYYSTPAYWDNPPLSMYLLSCWFKLAGDVYWAERIYSMLCGVVQLILIAALWKTYFKNQPEIKKIGWLPCWLFLISPLTGWCYSNNLMENTMSIFTTASVLIFVWWLRNSKYSLPFAYAGGALIVLAVITKGPVGLFPLAVPLFFLTDKSKSFIQLAAYALLLLMGFVVFFYVIFSDQQAANFLSQYLHVQLLPALSKHSAQSAMQFTILAELLRGLFPLMVVALVSIFVFRSQANENKSIFKSGLVFMAMGLSASLPILLSNRQHHYYLLPSLPLFAVGFACLAVPLAWWLIAKTRLVWQGKLKVAAKFLSVVLIAFAVVLCLKNKGTYSRDENMLRDIEAIQSFLEKEKLINADGYFFDKWALRGYLNRNYDQKICMPHENAPARFFMTKPGELSSDLPRASRKIYEGKTFDFYEVKL